MEWLWIPAVIFIAIFTPAFICGYIAFIKACKRKPERAEVFEAQFSEYKLAAATEERLRRDYEWFDAHRTRELCTVSEDGLRLHATLVEAPPDRETKGVIILVHGFRSNCRRDFCMQMPILHEEGYHLLATDLRSHVRSEGKYICYGTLESSDVMRWREEAAKLYGKDMPVILFGVSMGGATVLMASGRASKEDTALKCIIADCPFSSPKKIISHVMRSYHNISPEPLLSLASFWSRLLAGFSISSKSTAEILASSHLDALLFHGDADDFVPMWNSQIVADTVPERAELILFKGAKHAEAIYYDEKKYMDAVLGFIDRHLTA